MARPQNKADLIQEAKRAHESLTHFISSMSSVELNTPFDFSLDSSKKEAHWQRDHQLRDVLIHLYEWQQMLIHFVQENLKGHAVPFLPLPYNWRNYGELNLSFLAKHQTTTLEQAQMLYETSFQATISLLDTLDAQALFSKDGYPFSGGSTLGSYFVSATCSHDAWALKKLKAHKNRLKKEGILS